MLEAFSEQLASLIANDIAKENFGHIDLHQCRTLLMDAGAILFDVRPPAKVEDENAQEAGIKNAFYTPYPKFTDYLELLPQDKTTPIITGCVKGWFGNRVMAYLGAMGYPNTYVLNTNIAELIEVHHAHAG